MENLGVKLPNDPSFWDEIILNELGKKSPALASTVAATDIKESDYTNGNLTGLIVAANGKVLIPLVVRGFRVKPFDVVIYGDKIMALSERTISSALFSPSVSNGKLVNPQELQIGTDISRLVNPPDTASGGFVTPYNYSNKVASVKMSVLEALKVASDSTKDKFATGLANNRILLEKVATLLPYKDILDEIQTSRSKQANLNSLNGEPFYVRDVGGTYTVNGITKKAGHNPSISKSLTLELGDLPEDIKSSLLLKGEALVAPKDSKVEITILTRKGLKLVRSTTLANAVCREGDSLSGVFLSNVISFDHNPTHKGLFLSKDRQWIYQEHLTGSMVEATQISNQDVNGMSCIDQYLRDELKKVDDTPKIGECGTFVLGRKAIEPFRVVSLYNVSGSFVMSVAASSGQRLVVEYRKEDVETLPNQQPLMVASGNLVSKYFPTDRVYIVNHPYRYVSLKAQRYGARTPEEALVNPLDREDGCVVTIKKASGGYIVRKEGKFEGRSSDLLPSKLACHYELAQHGIGTKQAEILTNISPVSFILKKKASVELPTRHSGAEIPETAPPSYPRLLTNNTEQGQFINQDTLNTTAMLDDPETLNLLLTIGMGEIDDKVRQYVISNIGDIHDLIDKLGRLLLIVRTSESTGISESALSDLVQKLDRTAWELNDFNGRNRSVENREENTLNE